MIELGYLRIGGASMDWLSLPFVPEPKKVYGITVQPDHVYLSGPLSLGHELIMFANSAQFAQQYRLVELEIPPGFAVKTAAPPYKVWQHCWLGWQDRKSGEVIFEIHIREFRREDFDHQNGPHPGTIQHYGWRVGNKIQLARITRQARLDHQQVTTQSVDRGDGVKRVYVIDVPKETRADEGLLAVNEYLWKPRGFKVKVKE